MQISFCNAENNNFQLNFKRLFIYERSNTVDINKLHMFMMKASTST